MQQLQLINEPRLRFKPSAYHRARLIRALWWSVEPIDADECKEVLVDGTTMKETDPARYKQISGTYGVH